MATLSAMADTYNLPNYAGELTTVTPGETPFLTAIGGLAADNAAQVVTATEFTWQQEDMAAAAQPAILEGADPTATEQTRSAFSNVVQIFQYAIKVTYSKLAAYNQLAQMGNGSANPVQDELDHQIDLKLRQAARDINYTFLRGAYQKPSDNTTARKTRGLIASLTTNVTAAAGAELTRLMMDNLFQAIHDARGINAALEPTLIVSATQKRKLSKIYITDANFKEESRNVGGVNVQTIETDFGRVNIMLERNVPSDTVVFAHLGVLQPRFLLIPDKGFMFVEPLAKTGAYEAYQLYGEVGLKHGDEVMGGKITGLATTFS